MNIPGIERETVITYNEQEKTAVVYTCRPALICKLDGLTTARPDECKLLRRFPDGIGMEYEVPKKWVKVSPPRFVSEETRAAMAERARNTRIALKNRRGINVDTANSSQE